MFCKCVYKIYTFSPVQKNLNCPASIFNIITEVSVVNFRLTTKEGVDDFTAYRTRRV